jgi:hypothetical protein
MNKLKLTLLFFVFIICNSFNISDSNINFSNKDYSILFIGNSLTNTNNLPKLVKKNAKQKGIFIKTKMIAIPDYALLDHWNDGEVQKEISKNHYDFVIIQQGPSSQPFGKEVLIEYGKKYSTLCEKYNAKLCYFMVWPSLTYYDTFDGVIKNYKEASITNNAILCPVGEVWKTHFDATENFDYYASDGFHPSLKGSLIAAEIIVDYLFEK